MKKNFIWGGLLAASTMLLMPACSNDELNVSENTKTSNDTNKEQFERLQFESSQAILAAIEEGDENDGTESSATRGKSFVSLLSSSGNTRANGESLSYYEALGYDSLVPNKALAALLNPKGEVECCDTVFKINQNGTYFFLRNKETEFNAIYQKDSLGTMVGDKLYCLADGIYRYETFPGEIESEEIECPDGLDDEAWDDGTETRATVTTQPNYDSFPTFNVGRSGLFGNLWESLFGDDKYYDVKLSKKRRVRGRIYAYNYIFYSESGVTGMMQKKNWIGWSKTAADELRIGWNDVILTLSKENQFEKGPMLPVTPQIGGIHNAQLGDLKNQKVVDIYVASIDAKTVGILARETLKALKKLLKEPSEGDKLRGALIATNSKIYLVTVDEMRTGKNVKSMTHVFTKGVHFLFTINLLDTPNSATGWARTLQGTLKQSTYKLKGGTAIICGSLNNEWAGMKIAKTNNN